MGIGIQYMIFYWNTIGKIHPDPVGLQMLELGDQVIDPPDVDSGLFKESTGKEYFSNQGYEHTSVDINGERGALVKDLRYPEQFSAWHERFDILTNFGTTEHVEPLEAQYECWMILHNVVKPGGIYFHMLPDADQHDRHGAWKGHSRFYYHKSFFQRLAAENDYTIIDHKIVKGNCGIVYRKNLNTGFRISRNDLISMISVR